MTSRARSGDKLSWRGLQRGSRQESEPFILGYDSSGNLFLFRATAPATAPATGGLTGRANPPDSVFGDDDDYEILNMDSDHHGHEQPHSLIPPRLASETGSPTQRKDHIEEKSDDTDCVYEQPRAAYCIAYSSQQPPRYVPPHARRAGVV